MVFATTSSVVAVAENPGATGATGSSGSAGSTGVTVVDGAAGAPWAPGELLEPLEPLVLLKLLEPSGHDGATWDGVVQGAATCPRANGGEPFWAAAASCRGQLTEAVAPPIILSLMSSAPATSSRVAPHPPSPLPVPCACGGAVHGAAVHLMDGVAVEALAVPVPLAVAWHTVPPSISCMGRLLRPWSCLYASRQRGVR